MNKSIHREDYDKTLLNKENLANNRNLLYWYRNLYGNLFKDIGDPGKMKILEIGSGASPLKEFYPNVITSDVLKLPGIDLTFDAHEINRQQYLEDNSLDIIVLTNVIHHLRSPLEFLENADLKLKKGGSILLLEPYFSVLSRFIYFNLHHELSDTDIKEPRQQNIEGPLSSSNQALPYLIFFKKKEWSEVLSQFYDFNNKSDVKYFSSLSYFITGGISRKFPIPFFLYKLFFKIDLLIGKSFHKTFASFFIIQLKKRNT